MNNKPFFSFGLLIALILIGMWSTSIILLMQWDFYFSDPLVWLMILIQMHLYTGLFITAHDSMHGTVSPNKWINNFIGQVCTALYAFFLFNKLNIKHHQHHKYVHTEKDPDHHDGNIMAWYFKFIKEYISWWQLLLMAMIFNILKFWIPEKNLLAFWVAPSIMSTFQLFYFGTWLPHHGEHDNQHHSRTQNKNHLFAFLSCYFFGYHYEHHASPGVPWWLLWKAK